MDLLVACTTHDQGLASSGCHLFDPDRFLFPSWLFQISEFTDMVNLYLLFEAFFQALSPVELDVYTAAVATQQATAQQVSHAHHQHVERLRYEATLGSASVQPR